MKRYFVYSVLSWAMVAFALSCKDDEPDPSTGNGNGSVQLAISSVSPTAGAEGTKVVITGTGFSTAAGKNTVKFGSVAAVVDSATATRLVTKVPAGAKTGKISVEVNGKSAAGQTDFTVAANPPAFGSGQSANTSASVTLTGAAVTSTISSKGGGTITQHGHVWSKTNNPPTLADSKSELGKLPDDAKFPFKFNSELKNLEANTNYSVRGYITSDNITVYGEVFQVKTTGAGKDAPTLNMIQPEVQDINTTGVSFKGKLVNTNGFTVKEYGFCWSETNQNPTTADKKHWQTNTITKPLDFDMYVRDLAPLTTYYARAYAITTDNKTGYSDPITFKTFENTTPAITSGSVADVTETSIKLTGAMVNAGGNNPIISYGYFYSTDRNKLEMLTGITTKSFNTTGAPVTVNFGTVELTELLPNTTYYLAAFAYHRGTQSNPVRSSVLVVPTKANAGAVSIASVTQLKPTAKDIPLNEIYGMAMAPNGDLYISNYIDLYQGKNRRVISRIAQNTLTTVAGNEAGYVDGNGTTAQFKFPGDLELDASGKLHVIENYEKRIRVVTNTQSPGPTVSTLKAGTLNSPAGMAYLPGVGMLIADKARVFTVDADGNQTEFYKTPDNKSISALAADDNYLYVRSSSAYNSTIVQVAKNKSIKTFPGNLGISTGSAVSMYGIAPSRDGKYLFILMKDSGSGEDYLGVLDLATQKLQQVLLKNARRGRVSTLLRTDPSNPKVLYIADNLGLFKITLQ